jgi:hypothetical protein
MDLKNWPELEMVRNLQYGNTPPTYLPNPE